VRNSPSAIEYTARVPDTEVNVLSLHMCEVLRKFKQSTQRSAIYRSGVTLAAYSVPPERPVAVQFTFVFTSCE
jgi:hypothetical protein